MSQVQKIRRKMLEIVQDEMIMKDRIAEVLKTETKTIPELAEALSCPSYELNIWLAAMLRYNEVEAVGRADVEGYFKYELTGKKSVAEEEG